MSQVAYLLDENLPAALETGLLRREPILGVVRVGQEGGPPVGTGDRDLLLVCESQQRLLVSRDRSTMVGHVARHLEAGRHTFGVFLARRRTTLHEIIEDLVVVWSASEAEEWRDQLLYLPL